MDLALGIRPGSTGEMAGLLLPGRFPHPPGAEGPCAGRYRPHAPFPLGLLIRFFGTGSEPLLSGDVLFAFFTGSFLLGEFFLRDGSRDLPHVPVRPCPVRNRNRLAHIPVPALRGRIRGYRLRRHHHELPRIHAGLRRCRQQDSAIAISALPGGHR
ncbi:MAG: hypothetical protein MZU97_12340 [Bacillus subtilis]|nr:hypothetical protein [Bacillus subtilis]